MASRTNDFSRGAKRKKKNKKSELDGNVWVERDYTHGVATRFVTDLPASLVERVRLHNHVGLIAPSSNTDLPL